MNFNVFSTVRLLLVLECGWYCPQPDQLSSNIVAWILATTVVRNSMDSLSIRFARSISVSLLSSVIGVVPIFIILPLTAKVSDGFEVLDMSLNRCL